MGYRSDVVIAYVFENQAAADIFALHALGDEYKDIHHDLSTGEWTKDRDGMRYFVLNFESVKWYDGYSEVRLHQELLNWVDTEMADHADAVLVRVGEDDGDIERNAYGNMSGHVDVHTRTAITIDLPSDEIDNPFCKSDEQGESHE